MAGTLNEASWGVAMMVVKKKGGWDYIIEEGR